MYFKEMLNITANIYTCSLINSAIHVYTHVQYVCITGMNFKFEHDVFRCTNGLIHITQIFLCSNVLTAIYINTKYFFIKYRCGKEGALAHNYQKPLNSLKN